MKHLRSSFSSSTRLVCFFLAAYFFNFCIDTRDLHPDSVPEDLSINDIESVVEFIAEEVFNFHDAFAEHDEHDGDEGGILDFSKVLYFSSTSITVGLPLELRYETGFVVSDEFIRLSRSEDVTSPPPKA